MGFRVENRGRDGYLISSMGICLFLLDLLARGSIFRRRHCLGTSWWSVVGWLSSAHGIFTVECGQTQWIVIRTALVAVV
jgi:hypothetical protein